MSRTVSVVAYVSVHTNVEIVLDDIETDDLLHELKLRNFNIPDGSGDDITEMFDAFRLNKTDRAIQLAKKIACDYTGRIL